jgi:hypothetical protein
MQSAAAGRLDPRQLAVGRRAFKAAARLAEQFGDDRRIRTRVLAYDLLSSTDGTSGGRGEGWIDQRRRRRGAA